MHAAIAVVFYRYSGNQMRLREFTLKCRESLLRLSHKVKIRGTSEESLGALIWGLLGVWGGINFLIGWRLITRKEPAAAEEPASLYLVR
jgi:hypothetical protein